MTTACSSYRGATGVSTAFGTFGELLQGRLPGDDGDFLVTMPIARWTNATFRADPDRHDVEVVPKHKRKAQRLARMLMESVPDPVGGVLTLDSGLPEGKGLASSSADLVAAARAIGNVLDVELSPVFIESLLGRIEPTDGILYPGIVAYHHRSVRLLQTLGSLPSMTIVGIDEGGVVDTGTFNRMPKPYGPAELREYPRLLDRLSTAIAEKDLATVGAVATRSAEMNEEVCPKKMLRPMIRICRDVGALGVVVAHSGTVLGILVGGHEPDSADKVVNAANACAELVGEVTMYSTLSFS